MENLTVRNDIKCISFNDAMKALGCSKYFLYGLINDGKLKKMKVGKKTFLKIEEINNLFQPEEEK